MSSKPQVRFGGGPKDIILDKDNEKKKKEVKDDGKKEEKEEDEWQDEEDPKQQQSKGQYVSKYGKKSKQSKVKQQRSIDILFDKRTKIEDQKNNGKPYFQDGDPLMYTAENMQSRQALKVDPDVVDAINKFMNIYKWNSQNRLTIEEYLIVHKGLAELLRDDLQESDDEDELEFILDQDWKHDAKGKDYMTKDDLFESLFELVDIWVPEINKDEYILISL